MSLLPVNPLNGVQFTSEAGAGYPRVEVSWTSDTDETASQVIQLYPYFVEDDTDPENPVYRIDTGTLNPALDAVQALFGEGEGALAATSNVVYKVHNLDTTPISIGDQLAVAVEGWAAVYAALGLSVPS